jgi:hypothetical protein
MRGKQGFYWGLGIRDLRFGDFQCLVFDTFYAFLNSKLSLFPTDFKILISKSFEIVSLPTDHQKNEIRRIYHLPRN